MDNQENVPRVLTRLQVPLPGALVASGEPFDPFRLVDTSGANVGPASAYIAELPACGRSTKTFRPEGMDLLRWFRFLSALEVEWDQTIRAKGRDFCRWLQVVWKPIRPHWRPPDGGGRTSETAKLSIEECPISIGPGRQLRQPCLHRRLPARTS